MNTEQIRNNCPNCSKCAEEGCHPKCIKCQNIIKLFEEQENNHNTTEKNRQLITALRSKVSCLRNILSS